jgi:hypothetical protein
MNKYQFTYWITNGQRRIVKSIILQARYKRDAQIQTERIIKAATPEGYIAVNIKEIEACRVSHCKMIGTADRIPIIAYTYYKGDYYIGVHFWTALMITIGSCTNNDGSTSIFLDYLEENKMSKINLDV